LPPLPALLISKSASVRGFFLNHFHGQWAPHSARLAQLVDAGQLKPQLDPQCEAGVFTGINAVADAVEHLYARKNFGKVYVDLRGGLGAVPAHKL
jgi:NADPH-dependent curcumin reductase CurA